MTPPSDRVVVRAVLTASLLAIGFLAALHPSLEALAEPMSYGWARSASRPWAYGLRCAVASTSIATILWVQQSTDLLRPVRTLAACGALGIAVAAGTRLDCEVVDEQCAIQLQYGRTTEHLLHLGSAGVGLTLTALAACWISATTQRTRVSAALFVVYGSFLACALLATNARVAALGQLAVVVAAGLALSTRAGATDSRRAAGQPAKR